MLANDALITLKAFGMIDRLAITTNRSFFDLKWKYLFDIMTKRTDSSFNLTFLLLYNTPSPYNITAQLSICFFRSLYAFWRCSNITPVLISTRSFILNRFSFSSKLGCSPSISLTNTPSHTMSKIKCICLLITLNNVYTTQNTVSTKVLYKILFSKTT